MHPAPVLPQPRPLHAWAALGMCMLSMVDQAAATQAVSRSVDTAQALPWIALGVLLGALLGLGLAMLLRRHARLRLEPTANRAANSEPTQVQAISDPTLHMHQLVVNATSDMISVIDEGEVYRLVNDAWCAGTGISREQALGRTTMAAMPSLGLDERRQAIFGALHEKRTTILSAWVQLPGKQRRYLESTYFPFSDHAARQPMVVIVTRDFTGQQHDREALTAAAEVLRCTIEASGDALFATDSDPADQRLEVAVRFANDQLFQLFDLPSAWRPAPTIRQLNDGIDAWLEDPDLNRLQVQAIVRREAPPQGHVRLRDGRLLLRRFSSVPMGQRLLRVWSIRDITAEAAAVASREASAAEQRTLLDQFPGYIVVVGGDNRYLYANERLARMFRTSVDAMVGSTIAEVLGEQRAGPILQALDSVRREGRALSESTYLGEDGQSPVEIEVTHIAGPRQNDGSRRVYAFGTDVTEHRRAQRGLAQALSEAERANKAKSQFLSRMSHELRTPLNAVLGFSQLLQAGPMSHTQQQQVQEILRGGRHLLALINDLLDLSRVEAGELQVEVGPVAVSALLSESLSLMQPMALDLGVSLSFTGTDATGLTAWADNRRLRQVLLNLLSNAIKYNRRGGRVELEAQAQGAHVEFRVHDTGPGLTAEDLQRLFQPFERLNAPQTAVDGTGIGLTLSRSLVEAMGGQIGVHSQAGQGSTFWVRLPRADPAARAPLPQPSGAAAPPVAPLRRRALYIEDNPVNQVLMSAMLERELDLESAVDPFEGLDKAASLQPDLVLLDIQLPGIDGYEVLRRLRADVRTRDIPVVAVSANAMPADLEAGAAAGFDAYLTKPVDLQELLATVRQITQPTSATAPLAH